MSSVRTNKIIIFVGALGLLIPSGALSQQSTQSIKDAPGVHPGSFEVGGFAGSSYGQDQITRNRNFKLMGGGNVAYAATLWLFPYAELSYFPSVNRTVQAGAGSGGSSSANIPGRIIDFNGGVHIGIPLAERRVEPYLVGGIGAIHNDLHGTAVFLSGGQQQGLPYDLQATQPAANFGAGLRFYGTERWAFRAEFKAYKPLSGFDTHSFGRIALGVVYLVK